MVAEILFEIAVLVFFFLALGIGATIYEFRHFIDTSDKKSSKKKRDDNS